MYEYRCTIRRVVDGDTVDVDINLGFDVVLANQRIRLYGIDTPESRTRDLVEKKYGLFAKNYVLSMLPVGSLQTLETVKDDAKGKYGRILGKFTVRDPKTEVECHIHDLMVREYIGVRYFGQSKDDVEAEHLENRRLLHLPSDPYDG
mgnify:CR=1 FL=1|jgi:micrococcal nuclease